MVLPLEVGGAADFGLTWATHPLQIAQYVSIAAANAFSEKPASARSSLKCSGQRAGLKDKCAQIKVRYDRIDVLRAQVSPVRTSGTGLRANG